MKTIFRLPVRSILLVLSMIGGLFLTAFQQPQQDGGMSPWIWLLLIAVLLAIVWSAIRSARRTPSNPPGSGTEYTDTSPTDSDTAQSYNIPATGAGSVQVETDDLTIIEGIDSRLADVLNSAGITTFNQLAAMDTGDLRDVLAREDLHLVDPSSWKEQARLAAAGDMDGLRALKDRLKGGL